jgi:hypothetical protein
VALSSDAFSEPATRIVALVVFTGSWLAGTVLLRFYIQQIEDITDIKSILGVGRKKK